MHFIMQRELHPLRYRGPFQKRLLQLIKKVVLGGIFGLLNKIVGLVAYVMLLTAKSLMLIVL